MNELKPENKNRPSSEEILKSLELCDSGYSSVYDYETQITECKSVYITYSVRTVYCRQFTTPSPSSVKRMQE